MTQPDTARHVQTRPDMARHGPTRHCPTRAHVCPKFWNMAGHGEFCYVILIGQTFWKMLRNLVRQNATPNMTQHDTATHGTTRIDTTPPDAAPCHPAQPDTAHPDTAQPDTAPPDTTQPDTARPDMTLPDTAWADMVPTDMARHNLPWQVLLLHLHRQYALARNVRPCIAQHCSTVVLFSSSFLPLPPRSVQGRSGLTRHVSA